MNRYSRVHARAPEHRDNSKCAARILNPQETDRLLASFPNTRLSYEASIHKNDKQPIVSGYKCFILPKGKRCVAWVTEWNRRKICAVIDVAGANHIGGNGNVVSPMIRRFHQENGWYPGTVRLYDTCVESSLVYGTVFGGVLFRLNDNQYFSIHTIYWYKGEPIPSLTLSGHIRLCENIFAEREIRQIAYTKQNSIVFGLPVLCHTEQDAEIVAQGLPYPVFAIQYRYNTHTRVVQRIIQSDATNNERGIVSRPPQALPQALPQAPQPRVYYTPPTDEMLTNIQATFIVRPNVQNDIYELFVRSSSSSSRGCEYVFHNFTHIPSYKTSVMMNRLFRNIAENRSLDALEESEDEAGFENTEPDKYVSLDKEYLMVCRFHKRFCRWVPLEIAASTGMAHVITDQQVKQHEIRYLNSRRNSKWV